jgi:hypothetical protein
LGLSCNQATIQGAVKGGWRVKGVEVPPRGRFGFCAGLGTSLSHGRPIFSDGGEAWVGIKLLLQLGVASGGPYKGGLVA